jgi:hypothetical protein
MSAGVNKNFLQLGAIFNQKLTKPLFSHNKPALELSLR